RARWTTRTSPQSARSPRDTAAEEFRLWRCCRPQKDLEPLTVHMSECVAMRVLLVEDDPMIGESVQQGVRQDGFAVDWVQDGEAAELALRTTAYALVLLDVGLLRKNGVELLSTLRRSGQAIPVLIVIARCDVA